MNKQDAIKATYQATTYGKVGITKLDTFANGFDSGAEWRAEQDKDEAILFVEWTTINDWHLMPTRGWFNICALEDFKTTQELFTIFKPGL